MYMLLQKIVWRLFNDPLGLWRRLVRFLRTAGTPGVALRTLYVSWRLAQTYERADHVPPITAHPPLAWTPQVSILVPVYDTDERWLRAMIASVTAQSYPHWQLCLADDASPAPHIARVLAEVAQADERVHVEQLSENVHISEATNAALRAATGEFVALLDHDDTLHPDALYHVVAALNANPDADFVYTDEDKLDMSGAHTEPFFKPGWSPHLLLSINYITHFAVIRRTVAEAVSGLRDAYRGSQDYDLFLRVTAHTDRVLHVPQVLYHWRKIPQSTAMNLDAKSYALTTNREALVDNLAARGIAATVEPGRVVSIWRARPLLPASRPLVSVITAGDAPPVGYPSVEVIPSAEAATGDYLLFVGDGLRFRDDDWLTALVEIATLPDVGAVGGKLTRRGAIAHAGLSLTADGVVSTLAGIPDGAHMLFYLNLKDMVRDVLAVSSALMLVKRADYDTVGGFDVCTTSQPDVELCLRLRARGQHIVYTPYAHADVMRSRRREVGAADLETLQSLAGDFYPDPFAVKLPSC
jgi:O-antigen biosynthesis protein